MDEPIALPELEQLLRAVAYLEIADRPKNQGVGREQDGPVVGRHHGAFRVIGQPPKAPLLLVDERRFSGWTLAMTGGQLRQRGAGPIYSR